MPKCSTCNQFCPNFKPLNTIYLLLKTILEQHGNLYAEAIAIISLRKISKCNMIQVIVIIQVIKELKPINFKQVKEKLDHYSKDLENYDMKADLRKYLEFIVSFLKIYLQKQAKQASFNKVMKKLLIGNRKWNQLIVNQKIYCLKIIIQLQDLALIQGSNMRDEILGINCSENSKNILAGLHI